MALCTASDATCKSRADASFNTRAISLHCVYTLYNINAHDHLPTSPIKKRLNPHAQGPVLNAGFAIRGALSGREQNSDVQYGDPSIRRHVHTCKQMCLLVRVHEHMPNCSQDLCLVQDTGGLIIVHVYRCRHVFLCEFTQHTHKCACMSLRHWGRVCVTLYVFHTSHKQYLA